MRYWLEKHISGRWVRLDGEDFEDWQEARKREDELSKDSIGNDFVRVVSIEDARREFAAGGPPKNEDDVKGKVDEDNYLGNYRPEEVRVHVDHEISRLEGLIDDLHSQIRKAKAELAEWNDIGKEEDPEL